MKTKEVFEDLLVSEKLISSKRELRQLKKDGAIKWKKFDNCVIAEVGKHRRFVFALGKSAFAEMCEDVGVPMLWLYPQSNTAI